MTCNSIVVNESRLYTELSGSSTVLYSASSDAVLPGTERDSTCDKLSLRISLASQDSGASAGSVLSSDSVTSSDCCLNDLVIPACTEKESVRRATFVDNEGNEITLRKPSASVRNKRKSLSTWIGRLSIIDGGSAPDICQPAKSPKVSRIKRHRSLRNQNRPSSWSFLSSFDKFSAALQGMQDKNLSIEELPSNLTPGQYILEFDGKYHMVMSCGLSHVAWPCAAHTCLILCF